MRPLGTSLVRAFVLLILFFLLRSTRCVPHLSLPLHLMICTRLRKDGKKENKKKEVQFPQANRSAATLPFRGQLQGEKGDQKRTTAPSSGAHGCPASILQR